MEVGPISRDWGVREVAASGTREGVDPAHRQGEPGPGQHAARGPAVRPGVVDYVEGVVGLRVGSPAPSIEAERQIVAPCTQLELG